MIRLLGRLPLQTEQKYPVILEYAKASFERIKQRLRHLCALARVKRVLNDYTLASDLDRQFGDVPSLTAQTGETQGRLRAIHLKYHLTTADLLSAHQRHRYAELRGYR